MTDDGFVFGDDERDDTDESELFGAQADKTNPGVGSDRRFGTSPTENTDARRFTERVWTAEGWTTRRAAMVAAAVGLVVALGLVAYPLVMGALGVDGGATDSGPAVGVDTTTGGDVGVAGPTVTVSTEPPTVRAVGESTSRAGTRAASELLSETTVGNATTRPRSPTTTTVTPTPTPTAVPTRGFPAGSPAGNATTDADA